MIKHFKDKETEKIFNGEISRRLPYSIHRISLRKLLILNAADDINELRLPISNHLEALEGNRKGQYSIRINRQWRICFIWKDGNVYYVEIIDYH